MHSFSFQRPHRSCSHEETELWCVCQNTFRFNSMVLQRSIRIGNHHQNLEPLHNIKCNRVSSWTVYTFGKTYFKEKRGNLSVTLVKSKFLTDRQFLQAKIPAKDHLSCSRWNQGGTIIRRSEHFLNLARSSALEKRMGDNCFDHE